MNDADPEPKIEPPAEGWTLIEAAMFLLPDLWLQVNPSKFNLLESSAEREDRRQLGMRLVSLLVRRFQAGELVTTGVPRGNPLGGAVPIPPSAWAAATVRLIGLWSYQWVSEEDDGSILLPGGVVLDAVRVHRAHPIIPTATRADLVRLFVHGYAAATRDLTGNVVKRDNKEMAAAVAAAVTGSTVDELREAFKALPNDLRNPSPLERQAARRQK